ncbi:hypothetical protein P4J23_17565 [Bacillus cereus]|uniref:hypothetical protein n=1 Tax=Bacillus cereus TaxID=1396 RepID=UPI0001A0ED52|nr:hypothetical protein [Bacillus cereus]EEL58123.1 hypothetical protein bcere0023_1690 [Bacillus cereus Rock4-2]MDF3554772.1 hypothetical protein [Bacillus cereus]MDN4100285.1 hypothetical protein [Bacillus cereus]MEB9611836.1 hypothetical protein [Bacillus cereus]HDV8368065.1 hypothetical protein [Bacillus cereus]
MINIDITLTISDSKVENIHTDRVLDSTSIKGLFSIVKFTALTAEDIILENILIVIKNNESLFITYDLKIAIV